MSSWANRGLPRKRDISKIPEDFRPTIVPRAHRPEVVISESFHEVSYNEVVNYFRNNEPQFEKPEKSKNSEPLNPRQYVIKKIETLPSSSAIELKYQNKSYVFIILRHLINTRDNDLWISSYNSIRKFYTNKIIIIDDNSSINTVDGKLFNTEVIKSEFNGAGEILPYYYYLKYKWADRMIFLHDSMFINRLFKDKELDGNFKFNWYFKSNSLDNYRKITNYLSLLKNSTDLQAFTTNNMTWVGCFGASAICDLETIRYLEDKYNLFSLLVFNIKTRNDREIFERILGIILFYDKIIDENSCSNFGDITKYPNAFNYDNNNFEIAERLLIQNGYDTAIIKIWRGR
jgi:hypothetical protein